MFHVVLLRIILNVLGFNCFEYFPKLRKRKKILAQKLSGQVLVWYHLFIYFIMFYIFVVIEKKDRFNYICSVELSGVLVVALNDSNNY